MWVVDPEDGDPPPDPEEEHAPELLPEGLPLRSLEIEGDDILVLLRRVFGVLHGTVGAQYLTASSAVKWVRPGASGTSRDAPARRGGRASTGKRYPWLPEAPFPSPGQ